MKPKLTPAEVGEARILLDTGMPMAAVARQFGVDYETIKRKIDPEFAQRRKDQINRRRRGEKSPAVVKIIEKKAMNLSPNQVKEARKLRSRGMSWAAIGRNLGAEYKAVRRKIDPEFVERGKQRSRHRDRTNPVLADRDVGQFRPTQAEFLAAQKLIPADTRDLTARICGDPLVGRRALDMRGAK